jgi:FkbM family methyltransferase
MQTVFPDHAEERLKAAFFGTRPGFFVEVGANDPRQGSQTWALEQAGWRGVLVEPQPDLAAKLKAGRTAQVFPVACSSPENAGGTMTLHLAGMLSSLDPRLAVTGLKPEWAIEVPVRTLDDILVEAGAPAPVDFLSIDIEGHETEALSGFSFARWRPRLILIEDHVTNLAKHRLLSRSGYRLIRRTGLNGWYVPRATAPRLGFSGWWSLVRKYYLALPIRSLRELKRRLRDRVRFGRTTISGPSNG